MGSKKGDALMNKERLDKYIDFHLEELTDMISKEEKTYPEKPKEFEIVRREGRTFAEVITRDAIGKNEDGSFSCLEYACMVPLAAADRLEPDFVIKRVEALEAACIRKKRDELLRDTDWCMCYDNVSRLKEEELDDIIKYRQALRDIPQQPDFPWDVVFPELPEAYYAGIYPGLIS